MRYTAIGAVLLQVAVEELYSFRDTFFQRHPLEAAGQKGALLDAKLQEVLKLLRAKEGALKGAFSISTVELNF